MKHEHPADRPMGKRCPVVCRTSDLDFDFGAPALPDWSTFGSRWHIEHVEEEHGLRADVYRSMGLM